MLNRSAEAIAKWKGFDSAIDRWLDERHELIVLLSEFAEDHSINGNAEKVDQFTTLLIDYISAGHFEFYQRLVEEGKDFDEEIAMKQVSGLLDTIDASTQKALDFNDKYGDRIDPDSLTADLSHLAESLAVRFDAEDQMINSLHKAHQEALTT